MVEDPDLWNDSDHAQEIMRERTKLDKQIGNVKSIAQGLEDNIELIELAESDNDEEIIKDAEKELGALKKKAEKLQLSALLSDEADDCEAYLDVNSGAGGTEACDWAAMLLRMYSRWADQHGYKVQLLNKSDGEESATIKIEGEQAYGWLKSENGVHRLVRISPFDSNAKRHTSFASVSVAPVIDDSIDVDIDEKDLKMDTYRSSGAGGQHVNTTDSAVRITHRPSGIVVACQNERSQHKNRAQAMGMLRARLYERELQRRADEKNAAHGEKTDIGWGHQIRSYVLQPYQMIKDLRTSVENTNANAVLDGDIDGFLEASLASKVDSAK